MLQVALHGVAAPGGRILAVLGVVGEPAVQFGLAPVGQVRDAPGQRQPGVGVTAGAVIVAALPVRVGFDGRDLRALGADLVGGRAGADGQQQPGADPVGVADHPLQAPGAPIEPPSTAATSVIPSAASAAMSASTWSRIEIAGNREPHGLPSRASDAGPVEPQQPPRALVATAHQRSVSIGAPGPMIPSHQPGVGCPGRRDRRHGSPR